MMGRGSSEILEEIEEIRDQIGQECLENKEKLNSKELMALSCQIDKLINEYYQCVNYR